MDEENDEIEVSHSVIPKFVTFDENKSAYIIRPIDPRDIGFHKVEGKLSDQLGST